MFAILIKELKPENECLENPCYVIERVMKIFDTMLSSDTMNRQLDNTATETEVQNKHGIVQLEAMSITLSQNLPISLLIIPPF